MTVPAMGGLSSPVNLPSPLVELHDDRWERRGVRLYVKRDDRISAEMSGNKWRKLKYNIAAARDRGYGRLLTFGGAFSNHIRATAVAGRYFGFETVGVIRGEEHRPLNEVLEFAESQGMVLTYLDRGTYRMKSDPAVLDKLLERFGPCYIIPEGGSNALGVRGCAELPGEITVDFDVICCACGTGCTLAGISAGLPPRSRALGFSVLKGNGFLGAEVRRVQREAYGAELANWSVDYGSHFGGYAKRTPALGSFIAEFHARHGIILDWAYEAKMFFGLLARIDSGDFSGMTIVAVLS